MVITISHSGYIKRIAGLDATGSSAAAGAGSPAQDLKEEDFVEHLFIGEHARLHARSSPTTGACYWLKVHEIPQARPRRAGQAGRQPDQRHARHEQIQAMVPVREFTDDQYLLFATRKGTVKKTVLSAVRRTRAPTASRRSRSSRATS